MSYGNQSILRFDIEVSAIQSVAVEEAKKTHLCGQDRTPGGDNQELTESEG